MRILCDDQRRLEYELFKAVQDCNLREVRNLIREGANPNILLKRKGGLSPFHLAVGLSAPKSLEIAAVLLDCNADPNNRASDGLTPLHIAAMWGHLNAVELLVNSDADIELCDSEGKTALMLAHESGQYHVARYLDKLQRHIITAVCEAEEACARQSRHAYEERNMLSEESDTSSMRNVNLKLNIEPQRSSKTDAFTQFPDGGAPEADRKMKWVEWARLMCSSTRAGKKFSNPQSIQSLNTPDILGYSPALTTCLRGGPMTNLLGEADRLSSHFAGNTNRSSFTYLLLDSRYTKNLPCRASKLPLQECFRVFCSSLFHVGRGKKNRPLAHLQEAARRTKDTSKTRRVRSLWNGGYGVVSVHLNEHICPEEALTRQSLLTAAVGLQNLTNIKGGALHPPFNGWSRDLIEQVGVVLLFRALLEYLHTGERLWFKHDIV